MSKHRKIREIFGPTTPFHPNQLVGKAHMPPEGLCQKETMYKLACKISDLEILYNRGLLKMNGWDCLRWRIIKKASTPLLPGQSARGCVKTIIGNIAGCDSNNDPGVRAAVIESARLTGRLTSFGSKKKTKSSRSKRSRVSKSSELRPHPNATSLQQQVAEPSKMAQLMEACQEAMIRLKKTPPPHEPIYTGVNGYRQKMKRESQSKN